MAQCMTIKDKKALDANFIKSLKYHLDALSLPFTTLVKRTITPSGSEVKFDLQPIRCHRRYRKHGLNGERHCKLSGGGSPTAAAKHR